MPYRSKRYRKDAERATEQALPLADAIKRLKTFSKTRFDQSVDLVCHLGIDANQADQAVRGSFSFPRGIGKSKKVIAFCPDGDVAVAKAAGAVEAGNDDLVEKVNKGWTDFDVAISHPSLMGKVGRLGKVLGPQGKMPSPKAGTVTADVATAVKEFAAGRIEFRNDKGGNIHVPVGRFSFSDDDLQTNIAAFIEQIRRVKPAAAKGAYLRKVVISGTMTPGVQIDVAAHAE